MSTFSDLQQSRREDLLQDTRSKLNASLQISSLLKSSSPNDIDVLRKGVGNINIKQAKRDRSQGQSQEQGQEEEQGQEQGQSRKIKLGADLDETDIHGNKINYRKIKQNIGNTESGSGYFMHEIRRGNGVEHSSIRSVFLPENIRRRKDTENEEKSMDE